VAAAGLSTMQPDPKQLVETALSLEDVNAQRSFLLRASFSDPAFVLPIAEQLKVTCDRTARKSMAQALHVAALLEWYAAVHADDSRVQATSLRMAGNLALFQGDQNYQAIVTKFDEATKIYEALDDQYHAARSQIGKVICLGFLGETGTAIELGQSLLQKFKAWAEWSTVFQLLINIQVIYSRIGDTQRSLDTLNAARQLCLDQKFDHYLPILELNRAMDLRDLGDLTAAEATARNAEQLLEKAAYATDANRARNVRAIILFLQGHYNDSLALFDVVRQYYLDKQLTSDAIWVDLAITNCLLQLGRYEDVLVLSKTIQSRFEESGIQLEAGEAILNGGRAYVGLGQYTSALHAFTEARHLFMSGHMPVWAARADLERAAMLNRQGAFQEAADLAVASRQLFSEQGMELLRGQADLIQAQAALNLKQPDDARTICKQLLDKEDVLWLRYQAYALLGAIAQSKEDADEAIGSFLSALGAVEQLRGQMMLEYRADFIHDKSTLYEEVATLYLEQNQSKAALEIAERAKSRALIDLIGGKLELNVTPRSDADKLLTEQIAALQQQRNVLYSRWMTGEGEDGAKAQHELQEIEQTITQAWHQLLIRNADYAQDASLATVRTEPIQPHLAKDELLIEFFVAKGELIVFTVSREAIEAHRLPKAQRKVAALARKLNLNFKAASTGRNQSRLLVYAQKLLGQLYDLLIRPISTQISTHPHLTIVPHGAALHYLPFQALHDGQAYLCEKHTITYLPSASLRHYQKRHTNQGPAVVFGYSNHDALPFAVEEAEQIGSLLDNSRVFIEQDATLQTFHQAVSDAKLLHLSTHADFNQNNPLFSGLSLADGQLSTLDIFRLQLNASLVTLSACQTGRSVVKGGDELLGLMRAFLYAGASSLLLSLWRVNDESTKRWMLHCYQQLQTLEKRVAVQETQRHFIHHDPQYSHPYHWAPFFLVGDGGLL
ncbi:MAG: CHAT domain-containing protein, partial [Candidatus Promineifilaceae bacterium]